MSTMSSEAGSFDNDRRQLLGFLESVQGLLNEIATTGRFRGELVVPLALHGLMRAAWQEVTPMFGEVRRRLMEAPIERFPEFGLSGNQLAFKLAVIERYQANFGKVPTAKFLQDLLEPIDTLLDSILDFVPGGHGISEFKKSVKDSIDEE